MAAPARSASILLITSEPSSLALTATNETVNTHKARTMPKELLRKREWKNLFATAEFLFFILVS
jgi:hypothetical protein